ncbi:MAG: hypothetical protein EAX95_09250 [Candidatus Thorarchaeota archaeon]|nr:hypothetical protein [Candidatus Thorarchaeota archaeon]
MNPLQDIHKQSIKELASYIDNIVKERKDPYGLAIALANDEGIIWAEGFGFTDQSKSDKVTPDTLFSTQSMGKCFTATAFLIMASEGLISLADPIRKHYPEFKINTIFGNPECEIEKITFRRMLSHTAGLTHEALVGNNYDNQPCSFEEHVRSIGDGWLKSPVGSEISYSNLGYDLTGYVMGLIRGKTFPEVMDDVLFRPLGISSATFDIDMAMQSPFARGYDGPFAYPAVQIPMLGAGGLFISAKDVAKLIAFHLRKGVNNGMQLIRYDLFEEMYRPQHPSTNQFGYGFGLFCKEKIAETEAYGHGGGGYGYQTNITWLPDFNIGVVVLSNNMKNSYVGGISRKAIELIIKNLERTTLKSPPSGMIEKLSGTYIADGNLSPQFLRVSSINGKLAVSSTDGSRFELISKAATKFELPDATTFTFVLDSQSRPRLIRVENLVFPFTAKYNDGPFDEMGPDKKEWKDHLGIYLFEDDARPAYLALTVINGHLYLIFGDNLKLHEHEGDTFFTAEGEVVSLAEDELVYKGITAKRVEFQLPVFLKEITRNELKYDYYCLAVSGLLNILYSWKGLDGTLDFIKKVVEIDIEFKNSYSKLGRKLHALGHHTAAIRCFEELIEVDPDNEAAKEFLNKIK